MRSFLLAVVVLVGFCLVPSAFARTDSGSRVAEGCGAAYSPSCTINFTLVPSPTRFEREFALENGTRADAVDLVTREVVELKPNNPAAIARGLRQVRGYASQLGKEFPGEKPFTSRVVTYDRP